MRFKFNLSGNNRKELVKTIGKILNSDPKYMGMPSMNYKVDYFIITPNGTVEVADGVDSDKIKKLLKCLNNLGFSPLSIETSDRDLKTELGNDTDENAIETPHENVGLTVALPKEFFTDNALQNLKKLIDAKASLIKKALAVDNLPIETDDEKISFPWFSGGQDSETVKAFTHFIAALCNMARNQKRITAKEKIIDNEKYAFRCFLLRLGFIGNEFKTERKILLKNFNGSSAFKNIENKEADIDDVSK